MLAELENVLSRDRSRLLATARRFVRNREDAEDIVQDATFAAFTKLEQFEGRSTLSTWLHTIVVRTALMRIRRDSLVHFISDLDLDTFHGSIDNPEIALLRKRETEIVHRQIKLLRPSEQPAVELLLTEGDDLSQREMARKLGVKLGTFKARLSRGKQGLGARLMRLRREDA